MKIANIDRESLRIFWTIWEISMKFLDVTYDNFKSHKETRFHLQQIHFSKQKPRDEGGHWPPPPAFLGLRNFPWACG